MDCEYSQAHVKLVVTSSEDPASMNIRARLLERAVWKEKGSLFGHAVMAKDDCLMVQVDRIHLDEDFVDKKVAAELGTAVDVVVFASRHKAESKIPTLTVHPIGNYSAADYGGRPGTLCRTSPHLMTSALRLLDEKAKGMGFNVSFETTHHGPEVDAPAFYIEIGSSEEFWGREDAADAIAETILSVDTDEYPVLLCVGGGHYAPRFTEVALTRKVAIGHMAANYALDSLTDAMIGQMSKKSEDASRVYFHKKGMPRPAYRSLRERFSSLGVAEVSSGDIAPL